MDAQEQQYIKGFNSGYLIAKHDPDLAAKLTAQENNHSEYFMGLVGGKQEYEKEAREKEAHEWVKSFSKGAPAKEDRDLGKER